VNQNYPLLVSLLIFAFLFASFSRQDRLLTIRSSMIKEYRSNGLSNQRLKSINQYRSRIHNIPYRHRCDLAWAPSSRYPQMAFGIAPYIIMVLNADWWPQYIMNTSLVVGIALFAIGVVLLSLSIPLLTANPAFTGYSYLEANNAEVNLLVQLMALDAMIIPFGLVFISKGRKAKNQSLKGKQAE